jgi:CubicO group peptidase (beta-lactamase class C family)
MTPHPLTARVTQIERLLADGIGTRLFPGAVWAVGDAAGPYHSGALGLLDPDRPHEPMHTGVIFDTASLTKIVAVWAMIGILWEQHALALDDPLAALLPDLAGRPLGTVTVHQLLTHTAGVPLRANLKNLYGTDRQAIETGVMHEVLHRPPGQVVEYTDRAALILGFLIERLTATGLDQAARDRVWTPLGMTSTLFGPLPSQLAAQCAPTELDPQSSSHLKGVAHDFSARLLGGVCGIAGVFSTLGDSHRFLRYLLDPCQFPAQAGFGPAWVDASLQIQTGNLLPPRGLFWLPASGTEPAHDIYVHYGFTGTAMWICRKQQRWAVLLTNRLYYGRRPLTEIRNAFRELAFT